MGLLEDAHARAFGANHRWISLVLGICVQLCAGSLYAVNAWGQPLKEAAGWSSDEDLSLATTAGTLGVYLAVHNGLLMDRFGARPCLVAGAATLLVGYESSRPSRGTEGRPAPPRSLFTSSARVPSQPSCARSHPTWVTSRGGAGQGPRCPPRRLWWKFRALRHRVSGGVSRPSLRVLQSRGMDHVRDVSRRGARLERRLENATGVRGRGRPGGRQAFILRPKLDRGGDDADDDERRDVRERSRLRARGNHDRRGRPNRRRNLASAFPRASVLVRLRAPRPFARGGVAVGEPGGFVRGGGDWRERRRTRRRGNFFSLGNVAGRLACGAASDAAERRWGTPRSTFSSSAPRVWARASRALAAAPASRGARGWRRRRRWGWRRGPSWRRGRRRCETRSGRNVSECTSRCSTAPSRWEVPRSTDSRRRRRRRRGKSRRFETRGYRGDVRRRSGGVRGGGGFGGRGDAGGSKATGNGVRREVYQFGAEG